VRGRVSILEKNVNDIIDLEGEKRQVHVNGAGGWVERMHARDDVKRFIHAGWCAWWAF